MLSFVIALTASVAPSTLTSGGMSVAVNASAGSYTVRVDGQPWLFGGLSSIPLGGAAPLQQVKAPSAVHSGSDVWGAYERVEWYWGAAAGGPTLLATSVRAYQPPAEAAAEAGRELLVFGQQWPQGHEAAAPGDSNKVVAPFPTLFTSGDAFANATGGQAAGQDEAFLNFYQWGGCQLANSWGGRWSNATAVPGGDHFGVPTALFDAAGRAVALGPGGNWLTATLEAGAGAGAGSSVGAGVAASVRVLPPGFVHETLLVGGGGGGGGGGGTGITAAMRAYGDALLLKGGKRRVVAPHARDFVLGHLGYWTDNGAYYGNLHQTGPYKTNEAALLATKARWEEQGIPFRYVQLDDWWAHQASDTAGTQWWWPTADSIPSGLSDWLGLPTSLYNPMYAATNNTYIEDPARYNYTWAVDPNAPNGGSALPVDANYYRDAFRNGSKAGMVMFEQDFLTNYQWTTNLTRYDVGTGMTWLRAMDTAAREANITLQLCMMAPAHALASTELGAVTNGRGTSDNTHNSQADLYKLGYSGVLLWAMGLWSSRDNVFSSAAEPGCAGRLKPGYNCTSADYRLQNVAAVLSGGPYGPADGIDFLNKGLIERSCRADGVLLKADEPLATTDAAMLASFTAAPRATLTMHVWATRSTLPQSPAAATAPHRASQAAYFYVLSVSTPRAMEMRLVEDLGAPPGVDYLLLDFWAADGSKPAALAPVRAANGSAFVVPRSPPAPDNMSDGGPYQTLSPVLPNSWCLLGEARKIVGAAARRFSSVSDSGTSMNAALRAASNESVVLWIVPPSATRSLLAATGVAATAAAAVVEVTCEAAACAGDDCDVPLALSCSISAGGSETCACKLDRQ